MTNNRHRSYTIHNWKKRGLICDDYKKLYEKVMNTEKCELCNVNFDDTSKNKRCMDHDHKTGLFRKTLCNGCNVSYETANQKLKCNNTSRHMFIQNHKTKNNLVIILLVGDTTEEQILE